MNSDGGATIDQGRTALRPQSMQTAELMPLLYQELRAAAASFLRSQRGHQTLQPTALVHEAYVRLMARSNMHWNSRAHFFSVAALAMRQILVNHALAKRTRKRGEGFVRVTLSEGSAAVGGANDVDLLSLHDALTELEQLDERQTRIVEMRYFAGLNSDEIASVLAVSPSTIEKDWRMARLWLLRKLAS